jgi:hypothetical protein
MPVYQWDVYQWDVFISHASEDKQAVAQPLAEHLRKNGVRVWLDANELTLGDSLRRKIDNGLAQSRYGLVVLSPAFFSKEWPQNELNGLFALESARGKVILPVWHRVDKDYIAGYSPLLSDRLGISTSLGLDKVTEALLTAIRAGPGDPTVPQPAPSSGRRIFIPVAAALLLIAIMVTTWLVLRERNSDKLAGVKNAEAQSAAAALFRDQARAAGYVDSEVLDSWVGDFLFEHWISPAVITRLLDRESSRGGRGRGDLVIGIWTAPSAASSVWRIYSGLTQPDVRPALSSIQTVVRAPAIEAPTGPFRENAGGLSVAAWSLVIGAYANSFPAAANWICSNFAPLGPPFIDARPRTDAFDQLSVQPAPACPAIQFLAVRNKGTESPAARFRSLLNLPSTSPNNQPAETIYFSVARDNDPHPLPIRVALLWVRRAR